MLFYYIYLYIPLSAIISDVSRTIILKAKLLNRKYVFGNSDHFTSHTGTQVAASYYASGNNARIMTRKRHAWARALAVSTNFNSFPFFHSLYFWYTLWDTDVPLKSINYLSSTYAICRRKYAYKLLICQTHISKCNFNICDDENEFLTDLTRMTSSGYLTW